MAKKKIDRKLSDKIFTKAHIRRIKSNDSCWEMSLDVKVSGDMRCIVHKLGHMCNVEVGKLTDITANTQRVNIPEVRETL